MNQTLTALERERHTKTLSIPPRSLMIVKKLTSIGGGVVSDLVFPLAAIAHSDCRYLMSCTCALIGAIHKVQALQSLLNYPEHPKGQSINQGML